MPGEQNPTDLASRGVQLQEILKKDNIWFKGPSILQMIGEESTEGSVDADPKAVEEECKSFKLNFHVRNQKGSFVKIEDFSDFTRLRAVVAYLRRPSHKYKVKHEDHNHERNKEKLRIGPLTAEELLKADVWLVKR